MISEPDTKAGALFPRKIKGKFARLERPWDGGSIWVSYSDDLEFWGESEAVMTPRGGFWDFHRIGAATPPIETTKGFYASSGFFNRYNLQAATRLAVKLEFAAGLLLHATAASGTDGFRGVQAAIGEVIAMRELVWALTTAMVADPEPSIGGTVVPRLQVAGTSRLHSTNMWDRVRAIFEPYFALHDSFPVGVRRAQKIVKVVANRARIRMEVTPHVLRHTFATTFLQKNGSLAALKKILGRDRLTTTEIYLNLTAQHVIEEYEQKW